MAILTPSATCVSTCIGYASTWITFEIENDSIVRYACVCAFSDENTWSLRLYTSNHNLHRELRFDKDACENIHEQVMEAVRTHGLAATDA